MTRESKLNPSKIKTQCQSAIATLEADNASLNRTKTYVSNFVNDTSIKSVSFDQLKLQCNNYVDVIDSMVAINNQDIADYITLSGTVGSETLDGNVIIVAPLSA